MEHTPKTHSPPLAVCSWSLRPRSPEHLAEMMGEVGLCTVQLALDPLRSDMAWACAHTAKVLADRGVGISSGMMTTVGEDYSSLEAIRVTGGVRPDEHWSANLAAAREHAAIARDLGISLVTIHAGFLPHTTRAGSVDEKLRAVMLDRIATLADVFGGSDVMLGLETGQESARTLAAMLHELHHPNLRVNFDPANMILYGMGDPVGGLRTLLPFVAQVHVKDALPAAAVGGWGEEVVVGTGAVDWRVFFGVLASAGRAIPLAIEREAGEARVRDIRAGAAFVRAWTRGANYVSSP